MASSESLAHYEILSRIGAGGMGEVMRAKDTRLGREVALKLLPVEFADDPERLARFEREARTLAQLQHPNIATIYGLERSDGRIFLVMELVDGEDLAERIKRGAVPVDEAMAIASQIAEGLEEAHDRGIVHRDLKPANVMLTPEGQAKILDFGLARAFTGDSSAEEDISNSPTMTAAMTGAGMILGTAAYMSPEQARGKPVDRRADIWALGVILYEMLTGTRLFAGETVSDTLAAVLRQEPDFGLLPAATPPVTRSMLGRCLDRDPRRRLRDAGELRVAFENPDDFTDLAVAAAGESARGVGRLALVWIAAVLAAAIVAGWLGWSLRAPDRGRLRKLEVGLVTDARIDSEKSGLAISPDGRLLAYVHSDRLWVRDLATDVPREVSGSEGAALPFWSPDGSWLGFAIDEALWKTPAGGGGSIHIGDAPVAMGAAAGAAWLPDGRIVLATGNAGLLAVPAAGGETVEISRLDTAVEQDLHDAFPLPDGRGVIYATHLLEGGICALGVWDGSTRREILRMPGEILSNPGWSPSGHVLFVMGDENHSVWALPFDLDRLDATGAPFLVARNAEMPRAGADGTLVYLSGGEDKSAQEPVLVDRRGEVIKVLGSAAAVWPFPALMPGGREAVAVTREGSQWDVWLYDGRGAAVRLTDTSDEEDCPVVSPDGEHVYFGAGSAATWSIERVRIDGTGDNEAIITAEHPLKPHYYGSNPWISSDGSYMLYSADVAETGNDIVRLRLDVPDAAPEVVLATKADEMCARVSPDGRYMAYMSDVTGHYEVYLARYPEGTGRRQVSVDGGLYPHWRQDGRELCYVSADSLEVVDITLGERTMIGTPRRLFEIGDTGHGMGVGMRNSFDMTPDAQTFLITRRAPGTQEGIPAARLVLVENWILEFE